MEKVYLILLLLFLSAYAQKFDGLALTPPMGWNSWNKFACDINEDIIKRMADAMVSTGMKDAGYQYIIIDDCWQGYRDSLGFIHPDSVRFPHGIKALADYVHAKGLKFGLYSDAGWKTCQGRPGSRGYEFQDAKIYAEWGVDYLKYDWCNTEKKENRWRDQEREQNIIETYQFYAEIIVWYIEYFCKIIKETSKRNLLTGVFYGYHYYVTDPRAGQDALSRLLECKDLDFLFSPNTYNRVIGEDWPLHTPIKSLQIRKKLWFAENDTRTCITTLLKEKAPEIAPVGQYENGVWLVPQDMETSVSFLWKNTRHMLTQGYGGWWFDMWGGWYSQPDLLNVISKINDFYNSFPKVPGDKKRPQVCVIYDEQLCFWDASYGQLIEQILSNRYPLAKTGTPYDLFLCSDYSIIPADQYKVVWLMGFLKLNEEEILGVKKWQQQGITVIWTNGEGTHILKEDQNQFVKKLFLLTDFQIREIFENAGDIYTHSGDVFYIGRDWFCIHTVLGGKKTINLPFPARVTDPLMNRTISDFTDAFGFNMNSKSTIII